MEKDDRVTVINTKTGNYIPLKDSELADVFGRRYYGEGNYTVVKTKDWLARVEAVGFRAAMFEETGLTVECSETKKTVSRRRSGRSR